MALFRRKELSVATEIVTPSDAVQMTRLMGARRNWQVEAWRYFDLLPHVHYPARFVGSTLSRMELVPFVGNEPTTDPTVLRAGEVLDDTPGGLSELTRRFAMNISVAADCWFLGTRGPDNADTWEILAVDEIVTEGQRTFRVTDDGGGREELRRGTYLRRVHTPHPRRARLADSSMRPLIENGTLESLRLLHLNIQSRLRSRLAMAGIFFVPSSVSLPGPMTSPDGTNDPLSQDPLLRRLADAMLANIANPGTPEASVPIFLRGPEQASEYLRHITLDSTLDETEMRLREELSAEVAQGFDLPPELQQKIGEANHWNAWTITDSGFRNHLAPIGDAWARVVLTRLFLRPWLRTVGHPDAEQAHYEPDYSDCVARTNQADDARELHDRAVLGDGALRRAAAVGDEDAPTEVEMVRWVGRHTNNPYLALFETDVSERIDWERAEKWGGKPGVKGVETDQPDVGPGVGDPGAPKKGASTNGRTGVR